MSRLRASWLLGGLAAVRPSWILAAFLICACSPVGDRVAGSSTEAGNAGGKLSLSNGQPAADVSVALVARSYLPDTLANGGVAGTGANRAGAFYRTRTGPDGRYDFKGVAPGKYRVMAIGKGAGMMADSVVVGPGGDTTVDEVLKPLGAIHGIVKVVGTEEPVNVWISPKATLKDPPRADSGGGGFKLDSLPEGEYELVPKCFTCQPITEGVRVHVTAGKDTVLADTLKVFPEYFYSFPDTGALALRSSWLPLSITGKVHRGLDSNGTPGSVAWDWNGTPLAASGVEESDGISETGVLIDSALFAGSLRGTLRVTLAYPDTNIVRAWKVELDPVDRIWPLSAVRVDSAARMPGFLAHMWRLHVAESRPLTPEDGAAFGIAPGPAANAPLPEWLYLPVDDKAEAAMDAGDPSRMTFILAPDADLGGRVMRPRWDERLSDFGEIRYLASARFGFTDTLEPSLQPGGLMVDRHRGPAVTQRYRIDSLGGVEELLGALASADPKAPAAFPDGTPLFFYRTGAAGDGFAWDKPLRNAAKALAVTGEGLAMRLDGSGLSVALPAGELAILKALLAPLSGGSPVLADTADWARAGDGTLEYVRGAKRGLLRFQAETAPADSLFASLHAWMVRNGLEESPRFPLSGPGWRYLAFTSDSSGLRYTGDTLVLDLSASSGGVAVREYLSAGSPGLAADTASVAYGLRVAGDSLAALSGPVPAASRLFGNVDGATALFALTGLVPVATQVVNGIPALSGNGNTLSGILEGAIDIHGGRVSDPRIWLDGRGLDQNRSGFGFLYTPEGGLLRAWRFNGSNATVKGWDKE